MSTRTWGAVVALTLATASSVVAAAREPLPAQTQAAALVAEWVAAERIAGAVLLVSVDGQVTTNQAFGAAQLFGYGDGQYPETGTASTNTAGSGTAETGTARTGTASADAASSGAARVGTVETGKASAGTAGNGAAGAGALGTSLRRLSPAVPLSTATVFDLASVTKVMATTFAVMLLVDDGVIDLDHRVGAYLEDFAQPTTVRQLLTHRSGLSPWQPIYYDAADRDAAYAFIRDFPLASRPGTARHYSDLGFMLLGILVEEVSGERLGAFLQRRLYGPLGLESMGFRHAGPADPKPRTVAGVYAATSHGNPFEYRMVHDLEFGYRIDGDANRWHGWRRRTLIGEVNDGNAFHAFRGEAGHAGLFASAADLRVLLRVLLNGGEFDGRQWVAAATVSEFLRDTGDGQALGWQVPESLPPGSFEHAGFTGTYVVGIPSRNTSIVLLTNRQNTGVDRETRYANLDALQAGVVQAVIEKREVPPSELGPTTLAHPRRWLR